MQYVDNSLISKWWGDEINMATLSNYLRYAAEKDITEICVPLNEYIDIIINSGFSYTEGYIDGEGRPCFLVCGIKIIALKKEEAAKYKILK